MSIRDTIGVYDQMEFADNPEARCSIVLILDVSGSMAGAKIHTVNQALVKFRDIIREDSVTALRADVAVIEFDHEARVVQDFVNGTDFEAAGARGPPKAARTTPRPSTWRWTSSRPASRATGTAASPTTAAWPISSPTAFRTTTPGQN